MDNRCFVIMPQIEPSGYPPGHFGRVYDYVIVPACRAAGFWPTRADNASYDSALTVLKDIIDSDVALFDLSANNSTALYGLAVRQSLDLPVVLAKDTKSVITFDAAAIGLVEYDESLRIDTVQKAIEVLGEALRKAADSKKTRHELLNRFGVGLPQFTPQSTATEPTPIAEVQQEKEPESQQDSLPIISPLPDDVGEPFTEQQIVKLKTGDVFFHLRYGRGKINSVRKTGQDLLASIQFESGSKLLILVASNFFRKINK